MAAASQNGQVVACITATRGEAGVQDESRWPAPELGAIRTRELEEACAILGVANHHWLDYPDGGCISIDQEEAISRITELIRHYNPDTIMTFGPDGLTGHNDHKTVSRWASLAHEKAQSHATVYQLIQTEEQYKAMLEADRELDVYFNIDRPDICKDCDCDICFELDDDTFARKMKALAAMPSQTESMISKFADSMRASVGVEAFTCCRD